MGINFPDAPTTNQVFMGYKWDGEKWATQALITPVGAVRYDTVQGLTAAQMSQARANIDVTKKNYIVNGAMMVSQEFGTLALGSTGQYPADMFSYAAVVTPALVAFGQVQVGTPGGSTHRIRATVVTADTVQDAGDFACWMTAIEGYRYAALWAGQAVPKRITLRFGVKAPAGTYCVAFRNQSTTRSYVAEYTIAAGEANTDVVKTVSLPAINAGVTYEFTNGVGIYITWAFICGSTYRVTPNSWMSGNFMASANQFNFMGTVGNVFELFDVSLTEGDVAPPYQVPDYGSELELCKRYFQLVGNGVGGVFANATQTSISTVFPVEMRAAPTMTLTRNDPTVFEVATAFRTGAGSALNADFSPTTRGAQFAINGFSGGTPMRAIHLTDDYIKLAARM